MKTSNSDVIGILFWVSTLVLFLGEVPRIIGFEKLSKLPGGVILAAPVCIFAILIRVNVNSRASLLEPHRLLGVLYLLFFVIFGFAYQYNADLAKWYPAQAGIVDLRHRIDYTVALTVLTLPALYLGYWLSFIQNRYKSNLRRTIRFARPSTTVCILGLIVGISAMVIWLLQMGGFAAVLSGMRYRYLWRGQASPILSTISLMVVPASVLLSVRALVRFRNAHTRGIQLGVMVIIVIATASLTLAATGTREKAMLPVALLLLTLITLLIREKPSPALARRTILLLLLTGVVGLIWGISAVRTTSIIQHDSLAGRLSEFNRLDISMWMYIEYSRDYPPLYGASIISHFLLPFHHLFGLPRPDNTSEVLAKTIWNYGLLGSPGAPAAGEMFINFRFAGYLFFIAMGWVLGVIHLYQQRRAGSIEAAFLYAFLLYAVCVKFCLLSGVSESILLVFTIIIWSKGIMFMSKITGKKSEMSVDKSNVKSSKRGGIAKWGSH